MEPNEVMTDEQIDALIDGFESGEQADESGVTLEGFLAEDAEGQPAEEQQADAEPQAEDQQEEEEETADRDTGKNEPGYVKGRIEKAVKKAVDALNAQWQERFDAVIKPLEEKMDEEAAQELVRSRKVGDIETARELVRLRKGQPSQPSVPQEQPRQANGQFAPKEDPVISARIEILGNQAEKIKAKTGIDVMSEFENNAEIKKAVLSGEMDFYEVAGAMNGKPRRRTPPAPVRSPNGINGQARDINALSDAQFDRLVEKVQKG